ncbi:LysR family transcriptional regulator [Nocardioides panacis]|uniref:LysR family transcriptional regulator n=1 Tax=Nocardioides panacis TaxID=2849501 RepID=A0A975SZH7_9ACTN|nr:LysR family transcriptional regulator [Nocardioides panacis]QWZ08756.1 LysR family transcriptional regulator [Nocardioides panacis]
MRIEQLEYLAAVTQHGSLRRASESLHLSQPALSEALGKLERELGVALLDRRRSGARISRQGQDLLPYMTEVLDAVDRLRQAAGDQTLVSRTLRIGTVNAANSSLLVPAVQDFRLLHGGTGVEVLSTQQSDIYQGLGEGSLDLGLVNVLPGDDVPPHLAALELVQGRPVACLRTDHPLARLDAVTTEQLRGEPFITMRAGYLMHRFTHRLFAGSPPATSFATDGAEMGKLMVAEGLGVSVLPDYSVVGDPLCTAGLITHRPIAGDDTTVRLLLVTRDVAVVPAAVRVMQSALLARARDYRQERVRVGG